jgi:hypothetical protein
VDYPPTYSKSGILFLPPAISANPFPNGKYGMAYLAEIVFADGFKFKKCDYFYF